MNIKHVLAILSILSLVVPAMQLNAPTAFAAGKTPTSLELDFIDDCLNTLTCNAEVYTGTTITFNGVLTDGDGVPLPDQEVNIVGLIPTPELVVLTTGMTDVDGMFSADWVVKLSTQTTAFQNVLSQFRSQSLTVFAEFAGNEELAASKSGKIIMSVTVNAVHPLMSSDKTTYNEGETVTIFIAFIDSADNFIDPEGVFATLNNDQIELERKKEGSYTFVISDVPRKHTQLLIVPLQSGYNANTAFLTIIVGGLR